MEVGTLALAMIDTDAKAYTNINLTGFMIYSYVVGDGLINVADSERCLYRYSSDGMTKLTIMSCREATGLPFLKAGIHLGIFPTTRIASRASCLLKFN